MENQYEILREQFEILESKYSEKSFKFLTIHQITKSIAKEKNINSLKKLILDMLFEVSLVKDGLCFEIKDKRLVFLDSKNSESFNAGDEILLLNREKDMKFLEGISIMEIAKLNEEGILPEVFSKFEEGYCLSFLGNNESFETIFIILGKKAYGEYTEVDDEFLGIIRSQVDVILENVIKNSMIKLKNQELMEKNKSLSLINEFSVKLGSTLDMKILYTHIKQLIVENFKSTNVLAYSYDSELNQLTIERELDDREIYFGIDLSEFDKIDLDYLAKGIVGIAEDSIRFTGVYKKVFEELNRIEDRSISYILPLTNNGNILGLIAFKSRQKLEMIFLETLKQQISMNVQNTNLYTMAITDSMTKLYLQTYFKERIELEIKKYRENNQEFSLIILDIDHFKKFNDNYGHLVGDYVLKEVAKIIKTSVRKLDIVSRYGGEEFGVMLLGTNAETAVLIAERIRSNIENKIFEHMGQEMRVTISGGVANVNMIKGNDSSAIIKIADEALYRSKNNGRNRITLY